MVNHEDQIFGEVTMDTKTDRDRKLLTKHLNFKKLAMLKKKFGNRIFTRKQALAYDPAVWGSSMAFDDYVYYLLEAGLVYRIARGMYQIVTPNADTVICGRIRKQELVEILVNNRIRRDAVYVYQNGMLRARV